MTLPPVARVEVVRETHFGVTVEDPYRWMERASDEFDAWLDGQAAYARAYLDALPDRTALYERIRALHGDVVRAPGAAARLKTRPATASAPQPTSATPNSPTRWRSYSTNSATGGESTGSATGGEHAGDPLGVDPARELRPG